jgi:Tfp pilus assembly protein PilV
MTNKKALTLMEIIVSVIILAVVMVGVSNLFVAGKRHLQHARAKMTGGEIGRLFLDPLQMAVHQSEIPVAVGGPSPNAWGQANNPLFGGTKYCDSVAGHATIFPCPSQAERTIGNIEYSAKYTITRSTPITNINKVKLDVTWTEP